MIHKLNQRAFLAISALSAALTLSGCLPSGPALQNAQSKIYFSHSIDHAIEPDFSKSLPTSTPVTETLRETTGEEIVLHFDNDNAVVRPDDIERLQSFLLNFSYEEMPVFLITGHTDSNHSDLYNISLSDRRAQSTQAQMVKMGVPVSKTALRGMGESSPVAPNTSSDGRQSNRRVTVTVIEEF